VRRCGRGGEIVSETEKAILGMSLLSKRNLTTIPRKVRRILNISHVDRIAWMFENGEIKVKKAPKSEETKIRKT